MSLTIVTVEGTPDEQAEAIGLIKTIPYDQCPARWWNSDENIGYARACNYASQWGDHDTLLFLNADTEMRPGTLTSCRDLLFSDPAIGVVGPRQVDLNGRLTHAGIVGTNQKPAHRGWMQQDRGQFTDVIDCVTVSGAAYFVKRHAWEEMANCPIYRASDPDSTGAFLTCNHYWNETALSYHLRHHGYRVVFNGEGPTMIHRWHAASPQGGWAEQNIPRDQAFFRKACDDHGILHD